MAIDRPQSGQGLRFLVAFQAGLAAFVLLGAVAYPQAGATALAIPLAIPSGPPASDGGLDWLGDAQIVGIAGPQSHLLVRARSNGTALSALASGWLLLHVPMTLCGNDRPPRT